MSNRPTIFPLADGSGVYVKAPPRHAAWLRADAAPALASTSEPSVDSVRGEIRAALREIGALPEPVISYSSAPDGSRRMHVDWPDEELHAEDPALARLVCLAGLPLDREVPELDDNSSEPDPELEAEIERLAAEDRQHWRKRKQKRKTPNTSPGESPPKEPPTIFTGSRVAGGWHWSPAVSRPRLRLRARLRR